MSMNKKNDFSWNKPNSVFDDHLSAPAFANGISRHTLMRVNGSLVAPFKSFFQWGLPCASSHLSAGGLLHHLFTLTLFEVTLQTGCLFSVALSLNQGFTRIHLALRGTVPYEVRTFLWKFLSSDHLPRKVIQRTSYFTTKQFRGG